AVDARRERELERAIGGGAGERETERATAARAARPDHRGEQRRVRQTAGLRGGAVDLVEVELPAEQRGALVELRGEALQRELLLLVDGRLDVPAGRVPIPPLAADGDVVRRDCARGEPARQELLRPSVAAGRVEIADAEPPGVVAERRGAFGERRGRADGRQIAGAAQVDVAGP